MRKPFAYLVAVLFVFSASQALADLFSLEIDGQAGYTRLNKIERPDTLELTSLEGGSIGVHGKLELLIISVMLDYQHFFNNADLLQVGLGADFKLPLGAIKPYLRGSLGLMMLYAGGEAFDPDATSAFETTAGVMARVGAGLDIPLGEWFALGVVADVGAHYLTELGYNFSLMGYLGLRI